MKKKNMLWLPTLTLAALLSGCQKNAPAPAAQEQTPDSDTVNLTVWGGEEDEELLLQIIDGFLAKYQGQANFAITYEPQSESSCTDALMADLEHGADVFAFADDQLNTLVAAGALEPVENAETIKGANLPEAVASASVGDTLYALPLTADNGYFLYYNKKYFSENDIQSLDRMLEIAAQHDKKVSMEWDSGWYVYSLFGNTGLTVGLNPEQNSPAIAALLAQSQFSSPQRIGGNFWAPVTTFTAEILADIPSGESLQELLDHMVEEITAP